jgi:desulfoferrodoxin (superoxide reductase-like protein)
MNSNKVAIASFDSPRKRYAFPTKYIGVEQMITAQQKHKLIDLIYANIHEEWDRELRLSQLEDLTEREAEKVIWEYLTAKY